MDFWIHVANTALILIIVAFGTNLLVGYAGLMTLAAGAQFGVGAYTAALLSVHTDLPPLLCVLAAMVVTSVASAVSALPALRIRGEYLILLTLALQMMVHGMLTSWRGLTGGTTGLTGIDRPVVNGERLLDPTDFFPYILVAGIIAMLIAARIGGSPFGRNLRAMRDNESAVIALGRNIVGMKFKVFAISGAFAGLAGGIYAPYSAFVNPATFTLDQSIFILAFIVLGGSGSVVGVVVGAVLLVGIPEVLRFFDFGTDYAEQIRQLLYGVMLILFMLLRPEGLVREGGIRRLLRRIRPKPPYELEPADETVAADLPADDALVEKDRILLQGRGLSKTFGGVLAAKELDIELRSGRVTALVGPNGAGKTTVFNLLTGFITPDTGEVTLLGKDVTSLAPVKRVQRGLARTFQDVRLFPKLTVLDNVRSAVPHQSGEGVFALLFRPLSVRRDEKKTTAEALRCLEFVGMTDRADITVESLSYGDQKLVSIARLVATGADVLLLDEPASGVDRAWVERILELIMKLAEQGKAVCLVEHNLDVIRAVADHAYFMELGQIVAEGSPEELMADPRLAEIYFGRGTKEESMT
ncbi:ATP-binding cassette domain-containing protein [Salinibacterium sp. ZJ450]|uniref:branched-chain amino acid ABC transporter ATP-binding protein/permease n=1 Tax=Salinibacterium sp. ZJ450 TaxID=2708338 RepID=UPI00141E74A9|nr:branched-chain amino acid ABC transporter ATP-binding protein/permease [Salinibacterium sp. ZJ450]